MKSQIFDQDTGQARPDTQGVPDKWLSTTTQVQLEMYDKYIASYSWATLSDGASPVDVWREGGGSVELQPQEQNNKTIENIDEIHPVGKHHFIHVVFWYVNLVAKF